MFESRPDIPEDVQALTDGFCAGTLSVEERERLESLLRDNEELQTYFLGYMAVHSGLYWSLRDQSPDPAGSTPSPAIPQGLFSGENDTSEHIFGPPQSFASTLQSALRGWTGFGAMAFTALVVLAGAIFFASKRSGPGPQENVPLAQSPQNDLRVSPDPLPSAPKGPAVARVEKLESQVLIERDGAKQKAVVGMEILAADSLDVPAGSTAELTLADHCYATLGPRTTFAFSSSHEAVLREGFVQIDASERLKGVPLAISTATADTKIHSGRLSMGADHKRTHIRVTEGSVLASRRRDGHSVEIPEGYCSTFARAADPLPRPSREGTALFVISGSGVHPDALEWERFDRILADRMIGDRIWRSAMPVRVRTYHELQASDLEDCAVIVLSLFPFDLGIEQKLADLKLRELAVPIICLEPAGFPVLGLTGPTENVDFGFVKRGPLTVDIANPDHPLAGGYVGTSLDLFTYKRIGLGWGRPAKSAIKIANLHRRSKSWILFAHEPGDKMVQGVAPARRVGIVLTPVGADYDSPIFDLFDAAIEWCMESESDHVGLLLHHAANSQMPMDGWNLFVR